MIRQNLHTHTIYDDGGNTPLEMAEAALAAGLTSLGFSGHSVLPWENDWSLTPERLPAYLAAVEEARRVFAGRLKIYSGLEWDSLSRQDTAGFDYVIGAVHHVRAGDTVWPVDEAPETTLRAIEESFHGDPGALAEAYFSEAASLADCDFVDIAAHFDLITKFDERAPIFDPGAPRYRDAAFAAMERLCRAGKIIEVNTGAIARGYRATPYPAPELLRYARDLGARFVVSADAHAAAGIACAFPGAEARLRALGLKDGPPARGFIEILE